jgi:hypothetical protein
MAVRDLQLVLLTSGGAELIDVDTDVTIWASDTDEDFAEEFPDILDENDIEHLQDYLEEKQTDNGSQLVTSRELEVMEIMTEPLEGDPDDEDDDDDEDDGDDIDGWDRDDDDDVIEGEVMERE